MTIFEVAELAHRQMFPSSGDDTVVLLAEVKRTAVSEYAYQMLLRAYQEKREEGVYEIPSYLLSEVEKPVIYGKVDISDLKFFKSITGDNWIVGITPIDKTCDCRMIKSTYSRRRILCDDDSMDDSSFPYYVLSDKVIFPKKPPVKSVSIVYANTGQDVDGNMEIDDAIAALVRRGLMDIYLGKTGKNDETINDNSDN